MRRASVGAVCTILLAGLSTARIARAEDPAPPDLDLSEQVLEIPQACIPDGVVMTCEALPAADSASADPAFDPSAQATTSSDSSNTDEASSDPSLGNLQDYENQGPVAASMAPPMAPMYASTEMVGPSAYYAPAAPILLTPIAPLPIARPYRQGPRMIPPRYGQRGGGRGFRGG
ncbi:MAG: hypothetical protein ACYDC3_19655, partial [Candidatus Binataceae bacterium]